MELFKHGDNDVSDSELFPTALLSDLELTKSAAKFEPPLTIQSPGEGLRVRALCLEDYDRGFLQILGKTLRTPLHLVFQAKKNVRLNFSTFSAI